MAPTTDRPHGASVASDSHLDAQPAPKRRPKKRAAPEEVRMFGEPLADTGVISLLRGSAREVANRAGSAQAKLEPPTTCPTAPSDAHPCSILDQQ